MNSYTFEEASEVGKIAVSKATRFFMQFKDVMAVVNVEDDDRFQAMDVDLMVVLVPERDGNAYQLIEVKGDRYTTGNFFLELKSNVDLLKEGCMLSSQADYIVYYFINLGHLYVLPMSKLKPWIKKNHKRFTKKYLQTSVGDDGSYRTMGICVPIDILSKELHVKAWMFNE